MFRFPIVRFLTRERRSVHHCWKECLRCFGVGSHVRPSCWDCGCCTREGGWPTVRHTFALFGGESVEASEENPASLRRSCWDPRTDALGTPEQLGSHDYAARALRSTRPSTLPRGFDGVIQSLDLGGYRGGFTVCLCIIADAHRVAEVKTPSSLAQAGWISGFDRRRGSDGIKKSRELVSTRSCSNMGLVVVS